MKCAFLIHTEEPVLNSLAQERGFSVRDVPRDGNCLFSAVAVQLNSLGIQPGKTSLREQLMEYLEAHPYTHDGSSHFRNYVSAPVVSDDPSNADTEAPSEQDDVISSVNDLRLRQQLRWLQYLERLNAGAWGDHIAVQGLADMLHMEVIKTSHNACSCWTYPSWFNRSVSLPGSTELMNIILPATRYQQMISLNLQQRSTTRNLLKIKKHLNIKLNSEDCLMIASCREKIQLMPQQTMCLLLLLVKVKSL